MYFITALIATIISGVLWFLFRDRKALHLEVLAIAYGSATLMWLIDVIFTAADGRHILDSLDKTLRTHIQIIMAILCLLIKPQKKADYEKAYVYFYKGHFASAHNAFD